MEYDSATGLYHLLSRYYGPQLGRFLSEDPLGVGGGDINLFTYVANNPMNEIDPLGQDCSNGDCVDPPLPPGLAALEMEGLVGSQPQGTLPGYGAIPGGGGSVSLSVSQGVDNLLFSALWLWAASHRELLLMRMERQQAH